MKLLFDQNLSWKLVSRLADIFPDVSYVQFHGLADKTDTEIWDFARFNYKLGRDNNAQTQTRFGVG